MILKLGEAGAIHPWVSSLVLEEIDRVLRRKIPDALGLLALLLDRSRIGVVSPPSPEAFEKSQGLVSHPGDAWIVAAAWQAEVDYFVTLDREHLLTNAPLREALPFPVGTPGDFLGWFRARFTPSS